MKNKKVLMIVFSNLYQDPRVTKMATSVSGEIENFIVLAAKSKSNWAHQLKFQKESAYQCQFIGTMNNDANVLGKLYNKVLTVISALIFIRRHKDYLLHCHDLDAAIVGWLSKHFFGNEYVYDSHEVWAGKNGISNWMVPVITFFERRVVKNSFRMISVSTSAAKYFAKKYKTDKVKIVTNSVETSEERKIIQEDKFVIMYQGRYVENRGLEALVRSADFLSKNKFKIVFRGFGNIEEDLKVIAQSLKPDAAKVEFLSPVPMNQMAAYASECHLAVVLTERTCLNHILTVSNKLFEYAAVARPMLLSDVDEHILLNDKYHCGVITKVVPKEIADNIILIYNDEKLLKELGQGSKRLGKDRAWSKEVMILKNEVYSPYFDA